jgi:tetratricopeptide (TPR) repeat protein
MSVSLRLLWPLFALSDLAALLLAITIQMMTSTQLPEPLQRYRALAWPAVALLTAASGGLKLWQNVLERRSHPASPGTPVRGSGAIAGRDLRQTGQTIAGRDLYQAGMHVQVGKDIDTLAADLGRVMPTTPVGVPAELPPDIVDFTGRRAELNALRRLLAGAESAVVISAVDGTAGIGKSALAIRAAHEVTRRFPDGQLYANLRGAEPAQANSAVALDRFLRALGEATTSLPPDLETLTRRYRTLLTGRRILVVLDNAAYAAQVRPLLPGSRGCAVLVTSRARLALEGAVPLALGLLAEDEAVQLLARLAGRERVAAEPGAAAMVVRQCGLLPLAIRIAGARLAARPAWSIADLADRLAGEHCRLAELEVGDLAMRANFSLSYEELSEVDARVFRLLGLLETPDVTAEVVAAMGSIGRDVAEGALERLVDAQLLEQRAAGRYRVHGLLRLFARDQAEAEEPARKRSADLARALNWYVDIAKRAADALRPAQLRRDGKGLADRAGTLLRLEVERANVVAAAKQAARLAGRGSRPNRQAASIVWELADELSGFFDLRKYWADWQDVTEAALDAARRVGDRRAEAAAVGTLGIIHNDRNRLDQAIPYFEQSLAIYRELGDHHGRGVALDSLAVIYLKLRDFPKGVTCEEESLAICRELGDRLGQGQALNNLGIIHREQDHLARAVAYFEQSLAIRRELGDRHGEGQTLNNLGIAHRRQGRLDQAIRYHQQSLAIRRELGDRYGEGQTLWALGNAIAAARGPGAARSSWASALAILDGLGAPQADQVRVLLERTQETRTAAQRRLADGQEGVRR